MNKNTDLSGANALNAVTDAERAAYESALAESEEARSEATELQDTAVILGLAVPPVAPPASLRESILAQVAVTPQLAPVAAPAPTPAERKTEARWLKRPAVAIASIAAAVALIAGGVAVGVNLTPQHSIQADALSAITSASDKQEAVADVSGGGTATLVWSGKLARAAIVMRDVVPLVSSETYQLWYIDAAGARSAGVMTVAADGASTQVLTGDMRAGDTVGVTVEPAGGSSIPTTHPVVVIAPGA